MKAHFRFRVMLLAACLMPLGACEITTFETAPIAAGNCDPGLAGRWLSMDEDPAKNGEVVLAVDAACQLRIETVQKDALRRSEPTTLHLGQQGLYRYAWVNARWALAQFDEDHVLPAADVYVMRIARDGDRLTLWGTDDRAVAHAIIDGELSGEVASSNRELFTRLGGDADPALLDHPGLFKADPIAFLRQPDAP